MSQKPDSWLPLYIADYRADTSRFSTEQHGAYLLIIMDYWRNGPPPDDDTVLAQITGLAIKAWKKHRPTIAAKFQVSGGVWKHKRIESELDKARGKQAALSERGKQGAAARWSDDASGNATSNATGIKQAVPDTVPEVMPADAPSPSPTPFTEVPPPAQNPMPAPDGAPVDFIFGAGKRLLGSAGVNGDKAGSILGKVRKALGDQETAALLARMAATSPPISQPVEYLMAAIRPKEKRNVV